MKTIKLEAVKKQYGRLTVFSDVSYSFYSGKCYLITGDNGSGKTTLINGILGLLSFSFGNVSKIPGTIGYVPERFVFPEFITVIDFLINLMRINNNKNDFFLCKLLEEWGLKDKQNSRISALSKGMQQKVLIIQALLEDHPLYIFDEPLNGLDITMRQKFFDTIASLKGDEKTILISTHYPKDYRHLAESILKIENGRLYEKFD